MHKMHSNMTFPDKITGFFLVREQHTPKLKLTTCRWLQISWLHHCLCYELGASDIVAGRVEVDGESMAGLAESDGVTSYPIVLMSFVTMLNVTVMKPCERTRVTTAATTAASAAAHNSTDYTYNKNTAPPRQIKSRSTVHIRCLDLHPVSRTGWLPKFNGDFLVQGYIYDKIFT